jgi:hypothetical protein
MMNASYCLDQDQDPCHQLQDCYMEQEVE